MNTISTIILSIWGIGMCYCGYMLYRNQKVAAFRKMIIDKCFEYNNSKLKKGEYEGNSFDWYYRTMPDYKGMLYSFKPLKEETWHPKELIDEINSEQPINKIE